MKKKFNVMGSIRPIPVYDNALRPPPYSKVDKLNFPSLSNLLSHYKRRVAFVLSNNLEHIIFHSFISIYKVDQQS